MFNNKIKILVLIIATLSAFAFQNCQKTSFSESQNDLVGKADSGGGGAPIIPNSDGTVGYQPNTIEDNAEDTEDVVDDSEIIPDSGVNLIPGQADNNFPEYDPGDGEGSGGYDSGGTKDPVVGTAPDSGTTSPIVTVGTPPVLSDVPHNDSSDVPNAPPVWSSDAEAAAHCSSFRAQNLSTPFDFTYNTALAVVFKKIGSVSVTNAELLFAIADRGPMFINSPLTGKFLSLRNRIVVSSLWRLRGPLCITSSTSGGGSIRRIVNHRGYAEINNMNVFKIRRLRGALVIRDSKIGKIIHHRGPIILINSSVGKIRNQIGTIYLVGNSSVGKFKNTKRRF